RRSLALAASKINAPTGGISQRGERSMIRSPLVKERAIPLLLQSIPWWDQLKDQIAHLYLSTQLPGRLLLHAENRLHLDPAPVLAAVIPFLPVTGGRQRLPLTLLPGRGLVRWVPPLKGPNQLPRGDDEAAWFGAVGQDQHFGTLLGTPGQRGRRLQRRGGTQPRDHNDRVAPVQRV